MALQINQNDSAPFCVVVRFNDTVVIASDLDGLDVRGIDGLKLIGGNDGRVVDNIEGLYLFWEL